MTWAELPQLLPWWGSIFAALYFVAAMWFEDAFVISTYRMYSPTADRSEGAVPTFFAAGVEARMIDYDRFEGIDPTGIRWDNFACSHQWMVHEARRWVEEHLAQRPEPGAVEVVWGFRVFKVTDAGEVLETFHPMVSGRAVRR